MGIFEKSLRASSHEEYSPKGSKAVLDRIDELVAASYGLSPEELDFIVNYDIKYRMGADDDDSDDTGE